MVSSSRPVACNVSSQTTVSELRRRRHELGYSQAICAQLAHISRAQLIKLEAGRCQPRPVTALVLSAVLGCEIETIFPAAERDALK